MLPAQGRGFKRPNGDGLRQIKPGALMRSAAAVARSGDAPAGNSYGVRKR